MRADPVVWWIRGDGLCVWQRVGRLEDRCVAGIRSTNVLGIREMGGWAAVASQSGPVAAEKQAEPTTVTRLRAKERVQPTLGQEVALGRAVRFVGPPDRATKAFNPTSQACKSMTQGLAKTFAYLAHTKNDAADTILLPALDSPVPAIRDGAMGALLDRHSVAGQSEIVARYHTLDDAWRARLTEYRGRMATALRDAVLSPESQLCRNGCELVLAFREFELTPALITACENDSNPNRGVAASTLLQLAEQLYQELAAPRDERSPRDPQRLRRQVVGALELAVQRFNRHHVGAVLEAFLLLVHRDNATLKLILADPRNVNYLAVVDMLTHSPRPGVMRLVLSFLDDPHAPSGAITSLAYRHDEKFVEALLRKIGREPSAAVALNLRRIENIAWLQSESLIVQQLDEAGQHSAVQLAMRSGVNRRTVFRMLETLLRRGKPAGRRAAAAALAEFHGAEANALVLKMLGDDDPQVQANLAAQLRPRGIPGAVTRLLELMESRHSVVRKTARESLAEFTFRRFITAFDLLEEEVRTGTGQMVAQVDPEAPTLLAEEIRAPSRARRLRGIAAAAAMKLGPRVEGAILERLADEDHLVRAEAARALVQCDTPDVHWALREALNDRSQAVRDAAENSLRALHQPITPPAPLPPRPPWEATGQGTSAPAL